MRCRTSSTRSPSGSTSASSSAGPFAGALRVGASATLAAEAGLVMGYMSSRVLGQYDVSLLGGDTEPRLLFVGRNLAGAVRDLEVDPDSFGRWICAHELTHVFQFQGVPWLREHMSGLLRRYVSTLEVRIENGAAGGLPSLPDPSRLVDAFREGGLAALVQSPEQRALMEEIQAAMSVIEGYSEHVMDAIAAETIPGHEKLREAMTRRRRSRSSPQRILERLLGFDVKLRQYEQGKQFADAVVEQAGIEGLNRVWSSPDALPTPASCSTRAWLARLEPYRQRASPRPALAFEHSRSLVTDATCNEPPGEVYVHVFVGILLLKLNLIRSETGPRRRDSPHGYPDPDATRTQNQRKASAQKAAATRRRKSAARSRSAKKAAETRAQAQLNTLQVVQLQAERAALIPVGAALTARDAVLEAVTPYVQGRDSAEKELEKVGKRVQVSLKRFERRGSTARNRALREVKRTRTRVERELRQRRNSAVRTVKQNRREAERQVKSARRQVERQVEVARVGAARRASAPVTPARPERALRGKTAGLIPPAVCSISPPSRRRPLVGRRRSFWGPLLHWTRWRLANRSRTRSAPSSIPSSARTSSRSAWSARSSSRTTRPRTSWSRSPPPGARSATTSRPRSSRRSRRSASPP